MTSSPRPVRSAFARDFAREPALLRKDALADACYQHDYQDDCRKRAEDVKTWQRVSMSHGSPLPNARNKLTAQSCMHDRTNDR